MNISSATLLAQVRRARRDFPFVDRIEADRRLPAGLLLAVGSRESNLRNVRGDFSRRPGEPSARFHGFGVWQRDSDAFGVDERYLGDVPRQARDAADLLLANRESLGSWPAAVAAYNCGPGNVRRALRQGRHVDAFTTGGDYSTDVLARRDVIRGTAAVDLPVVPDVPSGPRPRTVVVVAGDTLGGIAARFGTTSAVLQALNAIPDPDVILVGQVLRLPGPGPAGPHAPRSVVVRAGDTLGEIAARFRTTTAVLQRLNHLPDPDVILVGQVLRLP